MGAISQEFNLKRLGGRKPLPARQRFLESYIPEPLSGCWLWMGRERGSNNYGSIKVNGKNIPAHRYSWELRNGQIPDGLHVLHQCDNPACVNPAHLFLGNNQANSDDKVAKGRQAKGASLAASQGWHKRRGELANNAKITAENALEIFNSKESQRATARRFGVTQTQVYNIKHGKSWGWLTGASNG